MDVFVLGGVEANFTALQHYLQNTPDIQIEWCGSFDEGVGQLAARPADAVLLDGTADDALPDQLKQLRRRFPGVPVIVLGTGGEEAALEAMAHGAQDYLTQGRYDSAALVKTVRAAATRGRYRERARQEAIFKTEDQFQSAFNYASIGMALVGLDGRWLQVNQALCRIVGYSEAELMAITFQDITHPDDLNTDLGYVRQLLAGEIKTYQMEKRYFHKGGSLVWVLLSVSLVLQADGEPSHFIAQTQDITERKRTEELLQEQMHESQGVQDKLKLLHEITIELTNTSSLDEFYKLSVEFGLKRLGFDRIGLLLYEPQTGMALGTYGTDAGGNVIPEHHIRIDPTSLTGILSRSLNQAERFMLDTNNSLFSNSEFIGIGWNAAAVLWNGSENLGWLAIDNGVRHLPIDQAQLNILALYAVTLGTLLARKQSENNLTQERDLLRMLIDNSPDFIFIKDLQGRFVLTNRALSLSSKLTPEEMVGKTAFDTLPVEIAKQVQAEEEDIIATGKTLVNVERTIVGRNGERRVILGTKVLLRDKEGKTVSLLGISHDITDRKQLEAQTKELESERGRTHLLQRFISDMSHDFRTPLSVINSSLYLLQKSNDPEKQRGYAKRAEQQVIRLDKLLEELLLMQHLDTEMSIQLNLNDINPFVASIVSSYEDEARETPIKIDYIPTTDKCFSKIDAVEMARAITKLMDNAILYSPNGGQITVRTASEPKWVSISVEDTGIGISEKDLPHIFERFYRADQARSSKTGGSGVGLSIVQKIVEAHKGRIDVQSTLEVGSTFTIRLPKVVVR